MASAQESSKLMTLFVSEYRDAYGQTYRINRNTAKWAARDIIDSYGMDDCVSALRWATFVRHNSPFTWEWYAANVGKLLEARDKALEDTKARQQRRIKAKEWLSE